MRPYQAGDERSCAGNVIAAEGFLEAEADSGRRQVSERESLRLADSGASGRRSGCFDWKLLRGLGSVGFVELRTYNDAGKLTTPRAERLKDRRGLFVRQLLEAGITTADGLETFTSPDFEYLGQDPYPGRYAFLC